MASRRRDVISNTLIILTVLVLALGIAYATTTGLLWNKSSNAETGVEMLSMKVDMLQAELETVDLSSVPSEQTTLLETGTCFMGDDAGPPGQGLIDYEYYSYSIGNLTRYFVQLNGGTTQIQGGMVNSNAGCPGGQRTWLYNTIISACLVDPGRDSGVASLINQGFPGNFDSVHQSFSVEEYAKIDFHGISDPVLTNSFSTNSPCTPRLYTVTSGGDISDSLATGPQYDTLRIIWRVWSNTAQPYSLTLNNLRIPIPSVFTV